MSYRICCSGYVSIIGSFVAIQLILLVCYTATKRNSIEDEPNSKSIEMYVTCPQCEYCESYCLEDGENRMDTLMRYVAPTKLDKAPHKTLWIVTDSSDSKTSKSEYFVQVGTEEVPEWKNIGSLFNAYFDKAYRNDSPLTTWLLDMITSHCNHLTKEIS